MPSPNVDQVPSTPFKSIPNFRDVAQTINLLLPAPILHEGLLYRSARPDEASPSDRESLTSTYHIATIIDLRSKSEHIEAAKKHEANIRATDPSAKAGVPPRIPGVRYEDRNLNGGNFSRALMWKLSWSSMTKLLGLMAAGYRTQAIGIIGREVMAPRGLIGLGEDTLDYAQVEIGQVLAVLAEPGNYPALVHCTQGKDRTGLVVLLVLMLLGVGMEAMRADYVASERELVGEYEDRMKEIEAIGLGKEFAGCPKGFVEAIKEYVDGKYGGVEKYLEVCGVDGGIRERIRDKMLVR